MKVLIVEDHPVMALGTKMLLEDNFEHAVVDIVGDGKDCIKHLKANLYDIIIQDIELPHTDSLRLLEDIKTLQPKAKVLIYTHKSDEVYALTYINQGASGYVNKSNTDERLILAVKTILAGQLVLNQNVMYNQLKHSGNKGLSKSFQDLTERELELVTHLVKGERIKDIGNTMNIAQSTVSTLKRRIFNKLNVKNIIELSEVYHDIEFNHK